MRSWNALAPMVAMLGACGGGPPGVSEVVGARCTSSSECEDRCLGPSNDYPDGFCTLDCGNNRDCPGDTDCVDLEGGVCLFACFDNRDCDFLGPDWICEEENLREDTNLKVSVCRGN